MSKGKRVRAERAARELREREEAWIDPRLRADRAKHVPGARLSRVPYQLVVVSPVELPDGKTVWFQSPQAGAFNILEAKRLRDHGEAKRLEALDDLEPRPDGKSWQPLAEGLILDALADLTGAVLFSFAAIESLANEMIDNLPDGSVFTDSRKKERDRSEMVRWLSIEEKLRGVIPRFDDVPVLPKGENPWQRFDRLKDLRDDLMHAKERTYSTDAQRPSIYGRLLRGDAATCVEDAYEMAKVIAPGFFPDHVREAIEAESAASAG